LGLAFELDGLSIVHETIQDSICQGRVWDAQVPVRNGDLAGDEGGGVAETVVKDLEDILGILDSDGVAHPVVEDEQVDLCQGAQQAGVRAILVGQGKSVEETRDAVVTDGKSAASCGSAKGAGDVSLAAAGGVKHKEVVAAAEACKSRS